MTASFEIHAENITVGYDRTPVLRDLTFRAKVGTLTTLVGPNGCGKSTFLKAIARVHPLSGGHVTIAGQDIHRTKSRDIARSLAFLPQGPVAPEGLTVHELVAQGRFPHQSLLRQWSEDDAKAVETALRQTNLSEMAERAVSTLSGGQRQRAWIAMVLAQNTPVLLLDEPTAFLDLKVQVDLLTRLHRIAHHDDRTILVVLHDLNLAASFGDQMVMMRKGAIHAEGPVSRVFTQRNLKTVFDLDASVLTDPQSGRPVCIPVTHVAPIRTARCG